jgi:Icc-related predicted phosphoesterase
MVRVVCLSDTHNKHRNLEKKIGIPNGDILVHTGDHSNLGSFDECKAFLDWFANQPHKHKVFIAGNHDLIFETNPELMLSVIPSNIKYLEDSMVIVEGLKIWGSPVSPKFGTWGFNKKRGSEIMTHWAKIPKDVDILLTHTPPFGILDATFSGHRVGCEDLAEVLETIRPKLCVYGHIHKSRGVAERYVESATPSIFVNACCLNDGHGIAGEPYVIDLV